VQAVAWFRKAAEQGDATAQYNLGLLYASRIGALSKIDRCASKMGF
jgi:TPR repeat protein